MRITHSIVLVAIAWLASGCLLAGNYHSAKTLDKGISATGINFSATSLALDTDSESGNDTTIVIPNLLPEITYSLGLDENIEAGGRVGIGSLAAEGYFKYRFVNSDRLHVAVAPSLSAQTLIVIHGLSARLPLLATYELSDNFAVNLGGFVTGTSYTTAFDDDDDDLGVLSGTNAGAGAFFGVELSGETFAIRPGVEFTRYEFGDSDGFNTVNFLLHLSFVRGTEKQQLDRIENKIDAMQAPSSQQF
ncbi:hypothetical protein [Haliangium ochraceum]|uniref:Outer membrane protein beta-barrel domain-containing protein n=1 Tax=Haliangium ochraceum (strain DSM 14365 / JCM 11303 / SMP-2) TaxID=502025 RepID=D0LIG9_HALO1|nr:hypothetical protein [Haliangium ochraceum]ACY18325.1 hypothetical protein Hoch_5849 [Haliangium ochraceum DSM 14365]